jgi:hypothetical protein
MITEKDDLLHKPTSNEYSWTETNYFGFHLPDKRMNGEVYVWLHPNLKVASSGVYVWQGIKKNQLAAEYFDYRHFLPFPKGDLDDYELVNGLKIKTLEPLKKYRVDYVDEARKTEVHFIWEAIMPPEPYASGMHFDQAGKVDGTLILKGEEHKIDSFHTRDHSWGPRQEFPRVGIPPFAWVTGIFDRDFAFHITGFDEPVPKALQYPGKDAGGRLEAGYVFRNGTTRKLLSAVKKTERGEDGLQPSKVYIELTDEQNNSYSIRGEVTALLPWHTWPNMLVFMCQTRWECEGKIGWGHVQDISQNDYVNQFIR